MNVSRRVFTTTLLSLLAWPALADKGFHRHPHREKRRLRRARIKQSTVTHRRIRRAVKWGEIRGRRVLIVPKALSNGWELLVDGELVLVNYVHASRIIVEDQTGAGRSIDILKRNTDENAQELEGSAYEVTKTRGASR